MPLPPPTRIPPVPDKRDKEQKTGILEFNRRILLSDLKYAAFDARAYSKNLLKRILGNYLQELYGDHREYSIKTQFVEEEMPLYLEISLKARVFLLDRKQAEVGEYIHPSVFEGWENFVDSGLVVNAEGWTFKRDDHLHAWQRIA